MNTIEGTTGGNVAQLDAGYWTPAGPYIKDTLFPHVSCGMRARTINVASIEVRKRKKFSEFRICFVHHSHYHSVNLINKPIP